MAPSWLSHICLYMCSYQHIALTLLVDTVHYFPLWVHHYSIRQPSKDVQTILREHLKQAPYSGCLYCNPSVIKKHWTWSPLSGRSFLSLLQAHLSSHLPPHTTARISPPCRNTCMTSVPVCYNRLTLIYHHMLLASSWHEGRKALSHLILAFSSFGFWTPRGRQASISWWRISLTSEKNLNIPD